MYITYSIFTYSNTLFMHYIKSSNLDLTPFDAHGEKSRMWQLFGDRMESIIEELNEVLTA